MGTGIAAHGCQTRIRKVIDPVEKLHPFALKIVYVLLDDVMLDIRLEYLSFGGRSAKGYRDITTHITNEWGLACRYAEGIRRVLHREPELSWKEFKTAAMIRGELRDMGVSFRACAETGTVATLGKTIHGPCRAFRSDHDALPIMEATNLDYASIEPGVMHACGHDGHTALLLALIRMLKNHQEELCGPVRFLFQPAEEGEHGAEAMIRDGALDGVDEIFGWHNWPGMPLGEVLCPDSIVMCGNGTFRIQVVGRGGHASQPEACADPVIGASAINLALQQIVSRRLAPQTPAVISVTSILAESAATVIPQTAVLEGSIRIPDDSVRQKVNQLIQEIATSTAQAYGLEARVEIFPRYDATINHPAQAQFVRYAWTNLNTMHRVCPNTFPVMASEDFGYYLKEVPGAFALIGSDETNRLTKPLHHPEYDFNDHLIPKVLQLFYTIATTATTASQN